MIESGFDFDRLYKKVVRYYVGRRRFSKERANFIAQRVVQREIRLRTCQNSGCSHLLHDHMRNYESCLVSLCECRRFQRTGA